MKPKTVFILGPTASGKTSMAVRLAQKIRGEIISADSRQVFRGMDIGTGKDLDEYAAVPYHLIDVVDAGSEFSVAEFKTCAMLALKKITDKDRVPIICGGTGYYVKALLEDYTFSFGKADLEFSKKLESKSRSELYQMIKSLGLWHSHHWENDSKRRMSRAIERAKTSPTIFPPSLTFSCLYDYKLFYIHVDRPSIRSRIKGRLLQRLEEGMIGEAEKLLDNGMSHQRLERYGLEYKYMSYYLRNMISYDELIIKLVTEISRFAKRQMTFLRYLERCGHRLIPITCYEELWGDLETWL